MCLLKDVLCLPLPTLSGQSGGFRGGFGCLCMCQGIVISSQSNWKIGHYLCKLQCIVASTWSKYMIWKEVSLPYLEVTERNCGRSWFWILCNGGIKDQRSTSTSILLVLACQWSHSSCSVSILLVSQGCYPAIVWPVAELFSDFLHSQYSGSMLGEVIKCSML
jgi:hypothetical protein